MANYNNLKTGIDAVIKTNGRQEISGADLNTALNNMITELGAGYQYMGVAAPATNPGTPDANVFYLASEAGTYTNFGGIVINECEVCALVWNGTWAKQVTGAATADKLNQLGQSLYKDNTNSVVLPYSITTNVEVGAVVDITPTFEHGWAYIIYPCKQGDLFYIKGQGGSSSLLWAFVDTEYKLISKSAAALTATASLTCEQDGYIICNFYTNTSYFFKVYNVYSHLNNIDTSIQETDDLIGNINNNVENLSTLAYENEYDLSSLKLTSYVFNNNIEIGSTFSFDKSYEVGWGGLIHPCSKGDRFVITGSGGNTNRLWAFIDADNKLVSKSDGGVTEVEKEIFAPTDGYIVCNFSGNCLLKLYTLKDPYEIRNLHSFFLPRENKILRLKFKTSESLYRMNGLNGDNILTGNSVYNIHVNVTQDRHTSYFTDNTRANINVSAGSKAGIIPLRLNNYGADLFSIRLKYPVVSVSNDGTTDITEYCPSSWENGYLSKTDTSFTIYYGDNTVFKSFDITNLSVEEFLNTLQNDTDITDIFEIKRFGGIGDMMSDINNFDKIYLNKSISEVNYAGEQTSKQYYDAYPCLIKRNDIDYEHELLLKYKYTGNELTQLVIIFDGMYVSIAPRTNEKEYKYLNIQIPSNIEVLSANLEDNHLMAFPFLSLQHVVVDNDSEDHHNMITSRKRLEEILAYFNFKNASPVSMDGLKDFIRGVSNPQQPIYHLTFDDYNNNLWRIENIRNVFLKYGVKPSLMYLLNITDSENQTPPDYMPTLDEFKQMSDSGWNLATHGFSGKTDLLSYAQLTYGFTKLFSAYLRWYNRFPYSYAPHEDELVDYVYYQLRQMGINTIISGMADLGWFFGQTNLDIQYKRHTGLDSTEDWATVKEEIDTWLKEQK